MRRQFPDPDLLHGLQHQQLWLRQRPLHNINGLTHNPNIANSSSLHRKCARTHLSAARQQPWQKCLMEGAAILVGVAIAIIYWRQLTVMQGQLRETQRRSCRGCSNPSRSWGLRSSRRGICLLALAFPSGADTELVGEDFVKRCILMCAVSESGEFSGNLKRECLKFPREAVSVLVKNPMLYAINCLLFDFGGRTARPRLRPCTGDR
jgi:hypothetical protein